MEKNGFSKLELLIVLVVVAALFFGGMIWVSKTSNNKKIQNFKDEVDVIVKTAKNAFLYFDKNDSKYVVTSSDGIYKGMCITIEGLSSNHYLDKELKDWNGYIVIEKSNKNEFNYGIWLTNKKYVIDGYDSSKLADLKLNEGITIYDKEDFVSNVKESFKGTTFSKGGTANGDNVKVYNVSCINENIK